MDRHSFSKLGLDALTCNSLLAIYQSHDDPGSVAFVVGTYAAILLLFHLLRRLRRLDGSADVEARAKIHAAVWALTTLLTAMFTARVAPVMPQFVAVQVWLVAATAVGGFIAFFANP